MFYFPKRNREFFDDKQVTEYVSYTELEGCSKDMIEEQIELLIFLMSANKEIDYLSGREEAIRVIREYTKLDVCQN